jgi:hypothetical protein
MDIGHFTDYYCSLEHTVNVSYGLAYEASSEPNPGRQRATPQERSILLSISPLCKLYQIHSDRGHTNACFERSETRGVWAPLAYEMLTQVHGNCFEVGAVPESWYAYPTCYTSRASTVVPSPTPIRRPTGIFKDTKTAALSYRPSQKLNFELEMGFFLSKPV